MAKFNFGDAFANAYENSSQRKQQSDQFNISLAEEKAKYLAQLLQNQKQFDVNADLDRQKLGIEQQKADQDARYQKGQLAIQEEMKKKQSQEVGLKLQEYNDNKKREELERNPVVVAARIRAQANTDLYNKAISPDSGLDDRQIEFYKNNAINANVDLQKAMQDPLGFKPTYLGKAPIPIGTELQNKYDAEKLQFENRPVPSLIETYLNPLPSQAGTNMMSRWATFPSFDEWKLNNKSSQSVNVESIFKKANK